MSDAYERTVLGACLLEEEADLDLICSLLRPEHFTLDSHQRIFRRIASLHKAEMPVNIVTMIHGLGDELASICGAAYVSELTSGIPLKMRGKELHHYADQLKESWRLREVGRLGEEMTRRALDGEGTASELTQLAAKRLEGITVDVAEEDANIEASIVPSLDRFHQQRAMQRSPGLSFGIASLDKATDGMMPGFQTAVGAGSGGGKTTFMCQCILSALNAGAPVEAFLLEPTKDQVTLRLWSLMADVPYSSVTRPWTCSVSDASKLTPAGRLAEMPLRLHDRSSLSLDEVLALARLGINRYGTRLVCLDYIQRLKVHSMERDEPLRLKGGRVSTALADLVKGTQAHSLLLSQITTGRKNGAACLPTMFDFRESSQIENDAATIILLHRNFDEQQGHFTNEGVAHVPKMRFGSPCNVQLRFDPVMAAWTDRRNAQKHSADSGGTDLTPFEKKKLPHGDLFCGASTNNDGTTSIM